MENRNGLIVGAASTQAERLAALALTESRAEVTEPTLLVLVVAVTSRSNHRDPPPRLPGDKI